MRRPQVGQSLRSRCASWSHQVQKRRFSTAHGRRDSVGGSGRTMPDHLELLAGLAIGVDPAGLGLDDDLAARRGGKQAVLGRRPCAAASKVPGRCASSSSTAISCAGRAPTSTTRVCARRWRGRAQRRSALPGAPARRARLRRRGRAHGRTAARGSDAARAGPRHGLAPGHRPLLPVYVADRYEGFEARPLLECSDAEIETYVKANVDAVRDVCARARPTWRWPTTSSWGRRSWLAGWAATCPTR